MFLAVFAAGAAIVMLLWNWLIPSVIGWSALTYLQSAGILLLCKLLFGGFGKMGSKFGHHRHHHHPYHYYHSEFSAEDRAKMREHVKNMSADERREYIRNHMFGCGPRESRESADAGK